MSLFVPLHCFAEPWAMAGDARLRHDIARLADCGVLKGPTTSWPLSWADISRQVLQTDREAETASEGCGADAVAALWRVKRSARDAMRADVRRFVRVSATGEPSPLRTFSATPREEGEVEAGFDWTGNRIALGLRATAVADAEDGKSLRPDNSYIGAVAGNLLISAGYVDRWWGPGWEGSLILSSNARPLPAITVERNHSDPLRPRWLSWLGPWHASLVLGRLEDDRADLDHARFFGMRASFRPLRQLQIGLSRTAQWCGEGRPCSLRTFGDLFIGRDNDQPVGEQPGNQLAGYDLRWAFLSLPLAVYAQYVGEDEANGLPSKFLGLMGMEIWGDSPLGEWRVHAEYADTSCSFTHREPEFDCAYEHAVFTEGYRYRGRSIGHALDADGRMVSVGALLIDGKGHSWELLMREVDLNRNAKMPEPNHTASPLASGLSNLEIAHNRESPIGKLRLGLGFDHYGSRRDGGKAEQARAFLQWTGEF